MGVITRAEFVRALSSIGVDTLPALVQSVDAWRRSLNDPAQQREMHKWVFHFVKGGEQKRSLEKEMAVELLRLLIDASKYPLISPFLDFLIAHKDKGVPRDVWEMTLEFVMSTKADLSNFDENGACRAFLVFFKSFAFHVLKHISVCPLVFFFFQFHSFDRRVARHHGRICFLVSNATKIALSPLD